MVTAAYLVLREKSTYNALDETFKFVATTLIHLVEHLKVHFIEGAEIIAVNSFPKELFNFFVELGFHFGHRDKLYFHLLN